MGVPELKKTCLAIGLALLLLPAAPLARAQSRERPNTLGHSWAAAQQPVRRRALRLVGRRALRRALRAVAGQLGMSPAQLRTAIRQRSLTLPSGVTLASLASTGMVAARTYVSQVAANHPRFTAAQQQLVLTRVGDVLRRLLMRAVGAS